LAGTHAALDRAVFAAYWCEAEVADEEILRCILSLNAKRADPV
jgi:hypothetical protein